MNLPEPSYDPGSPTDEFYLGPDYLERDDGSWPPSGTPLGKGRLFRRLPKGEKPHYCSVPGLFSRWSARVREGDVWECDCGSQYVWQWSQAGADGFWDWNELPK